MMLRISHNKDQCMFCWSEAACNRLWHFDQFAAVSRNHREIIKQAYKRHMYILHGLKHFYLINTPLIPEQIYQNDKSL